MFPVAEPQREQVLWEEKGSWFLEDWKHGLQKALEGDKIMQAHSSHGEIRGAEPKKPRREKLLIHSLNKYFMSVCYTPGTVLGDVVRMKMGNILAPGEMNILPELTSEWISSCGEEYQEIMGHISSLERLD